MIREVLTIGDERLLQKSQEVMPEELSTDQLNSLIQDMIDSMKFKHGIGIAAVQIGVHKRIAIIGYDHTNPRYKNIGSFPLTVIINPVIEAIGDEVCGYEEGCLSVPGVRAIITRAKKVRYKYYDETGAFITGESSDFFARVLQHEINHMDGILLPMHLEV